MPLSSRTLRWLQQQGVWIVGTVAETDKTLFEAPLTGAIAMVMGAEGTGLRRLTQEPCDLLVKIPMFTGSLSGVHNMMDTLSEFGKSSQRGDLKHAMWDFLKKRINFFVHQSF